MMIPGLDVYPTSEHESEGTLDLVSFSGNFRIPRSQIFGGCRRIAEFQKKTCLKGTFSWVYHVCIDSRRQERVCIKKSKIETSENGAEKALASLRNEIEIISNLKHDNIMHFYEPAAGEVLENTYLVLECCEYFLSDLIDQKVDGLFEKAMVKNIIYQLLQALDYIHRRLIMHRDINPKNIMFKRDGFLKLANFENARELNAQDLKLDVLTKNYQAPELILKAKRYGTAVDIWAAGCVLADFFLMENLFCGGTAEAIFQKMINLLGVPNEAIWPDYPGLPGLTELIIDDSAHSYNCLNLYFKRHSPQSKESLELLQKMFIYNPEFRISAEDCLRQPYFDEIPKACTVIDVSQMLKNSEISKKRDAISVFQ